MRNLTICALVFLLAMCSTKKEIMYELPVEMLPHVKVHYAQQCDKGLVLYQKNCAKCHTQKVHGKKIIPDFKPEQLSGYTLRVQNKKHETNLPDTLVTEEDLGTIMTFLSYKKKNKDN